MLLTLIKSIRHLFCVYNHCTQKRSPGKRNWLSHPDQLEARHLLAAPNPFALSSLDGTNGFQINGIGANNWAGWSVSSAGDINGDGYDDLIIGAFGADPNDNPDAGESYVVFGKASGFAALIDLSTLDGTNGFRIEGINAGDTLGRSVSSAGDVNGDGFDDLIIGTPKTDPNGNNQAGTSYVVYGKASGFTAIFDLSSLNGSNGFRLDGLGVLDSAGFSVSTAGDVNGDGFDDLIIGAETDDPDDRFVSAASYVVFGKANGFAAIINLGALDGINGFRLDEINTEDGTGSSVSAAGDVNGDGFDDLIIGASGADPNGNSNAGESYVLFGKLSGFTAVLNLSTLNGANGFRLDGIEAGDYSGVSVSMAGDINGDGFDDLIIGAVGADPNGNSAAGASYVLFGKASGFAAAIDLSTLDGTNGFRLDGIDAWDYSSYSVSTAGDVNGDGFDDLIIGAFIADPNGNTYAGESYVVFGRASGFAAAINLNSLNGTNGFVLNGINEYDRSGFSVSSAGDVNGDGFDDLIIGAIYADPNGNSNAGESYVIFGGNFTGGVETQVGGVGANVLTAVNGSGLDILIGGGGSDTLISDGGADVLRGGEGDDVLAIADVDFSSTRRLQGGNGQDTLRLTGAGLHLDLTSIADNRITDIEQIDLTGSGNNTLTLNQLEVLNLSTHSNTLVVHRNSGDTINIGDGWTQQASETINSNTYEIFTQGAATFKLQTVTAPPATVLVVTTFDDVIDANDSLLSLREAIIAVDGSSDTYEIQLAAGTYTLSITGQNEDSAATGDLDILNNGSVTIIGAGANATIIDANGIDRVFDLIGGVATITGVTITGGTAPVTGFSENDKGGGIRSVGGSLTLIDSALHSNSTEASGGGIYSENAVLNIIRTDIFNNTSQSQGAGIGASGTVTISASSLYGNVAGSGGGGINLDSGSITITDSSIFGNSASYGAGIASRNSDVEILRSTFSSNSSSGLGGAIYGLGGTLLVDSSTISGNSSGSSGGGIYLIVQNDVTILRSTIVANIADSNNNGTGEGGGIGIDATSTLTLISSIVAGNTQGNSGTPSDLGSNVNSLSSFNLIGDPNSAGGLQNGVNGNITGDGNGNLLAITSIIDTTLSDNGGPTLTHALIAGSLAIDAGDPNVVDPPQFDQRGGGFARIVGDRIDIGALERGYPTSSIAGYVNGNWWVSLPDANGDYSTSLWAQWPTSNLLKVLNGDFNGDGLQDIAAWLPNGEWRVGLANANKTFTFQKWTRWRTSDIKEIQVGDFNGDGKDDIAGLFKRGSKGDWWVAQSDGTRFVATKWGTYGNYNGIATVVTGDFDGTSRDDIAVMASNGRWWVYTSQGSSFSVSSWTKWKVTSGVNNILVGDFDGDGKDDIAGLFGTGTYRNWWVGLSSGNSLANRKWATWKVSISLNGVVAGDFNGDGVTDIAGLFNARDWWVGLANTNRFVSEKWATWNLALNEQLSDIQVGSSNGDSRADIFARRDDGRWIALQSTGAAFDTRTIARWSSTANWQHVQVGAFYKPTASPAPPAAAPGFFTESAKNNAQEESVNTSRWVTTPESITMSVEQSSRKESLSRPTTKPASPPESYEAFGSADLLDLLYSV